MPYALAKTIICLLGGALRHRAEKALEVRVWLFGLRLGGALAVVLLL